jgi:hypothetical protein
VSQLTHLHQSPPEDERPLIGIGHWHTGPPDIQPHPQALVDWTWSLRMRWRMFWYLSRGSEHLRYRGTSYCWFGCWRTHLGSRDFTDGVWVWPEGLAHYVWRHGVRLPDEFVAHAASNDFRIPVPTNTPRRNVLDMDWTFWVIWSREHARFDYEPNCLACAFPDGWPAGNPLAWWRRVGRRLFRPVLVWRGRRAWRGTGEPGSGSGFLPW